ncbi:A24 family peptidase [Agrobacterium rosae]|uniref:Prepilin peptidase n=1 Tax=Agrobacterium rosae TaxID=1972867 RepID=A0AAW9FET3_9HYPH|nr:prepilin peptidase [Agrobacterium rosae]MDX8303676.1 prepilin peptidase [Agrobacterium rosae]POO56855.1 peptidase [Agrobacterium rosae]
MATYAIFLILPLCLAFAAFTDLFTMTIPNRVSLALISSFILVAPFSDLSWQSIGMNFAAGIVVFSTCFALFSINVMGGGDAKLLTASAVWFGLNSSLILFAITIAIIGGILTAGILLLRSRSQEIMASGLPIPDSLLVAKKVPYGIAIAIAGLLTYPEAPIVQLAMQHML